MRLDFLRADEPLTKQYTLNSDGSYNKTSYPNAFEVSSFSHEIENIDRFHEALLVHAKEGHCLLKGVLSKKLEGESRAGHVPSRSESEWIVFDLDGVEGLTTAEEFIRKVLPPAFHDASYVVQHSCSSGISGDGLRMHIFFLLEQPAAPTAIKRWLTHLNLETSLLATQLRLSRNGMTLCFPLDRTVADNGKLIFIAPPVCSNFDDPLDGQRIQLVKCGRERVDFQFPAPPKAVVEATIQKRVDELRKDTGLPKRAAQFRDHGDYQILLNPDQAEITEYRMQNGFMRVNLNGGDSWAYWYNPRDPKYLHNFKGEPSMPLEKVDPKFFAEVAAPDTKKHAPGVFAFRDKASDVFYVGLYDILKEEITEINEIKKQNIEDFYSQHGAGMPDPIPSVAYEFRPDDDRQLDISGGFVNRWRPTEYQKLATQATEIPPTIKRVLWSATGSDNEAFEWVINWLAYIFQTKRKSRVAVVLHGRTKTGKGITYDHIIAPIFGRRYCQSKELTSLTDRFNAYLEESLFVNFDEARMADIFEAKRINATIKDYITQEHLDVRAMRANSRNVRNFTNFIFSSNERDALILSEDDRRFTVCPRQEQPIDITADDIAAIEAELVHFASFLNSYDVDERKATNPLENEAKEIMRQESMDTIDDYCRAIREGDFSYFLENYRAAEELGSLDLTQAHFKKALKRWLSHVNAEEPLFVSNSELQAAYTCITGNKTTSVKFGKLLQHRNVPDVTHIRTNDGPQRGRYVQWRANRRDLIGVEKTLGEKAPGSDKTLVEGIFDEVVNR